MANELSGIGRNSSFTMGSLADAGEVERIHHATEGERDTSHVRSKVFWPLVSSLGGLGYQAGD